MPYYIRAAAEESDFLRIESPTELKVIDPACGSGHMLTYAFDLLYSIYEEEGYTPSEIPGLILAKNLFGIEVDARAGALAAFALAMKARARQRTFFSKRVDPSIEVLEPVGFHSAELRMLLTKSGDQSKEEAFWNQFQDVDVFGSLLRPDRELAKQLASHLDECVDDDGDLLAQEVISRAQRVISQSAALTNRCAVAVTNPPYMGSRNMESRLADFAKAEFPDSKSDLCTMFIERCLGLVEPQGLVAMITSHTWMFISSFERLRTRLLSEVGFRSMAHLGTGAFDSISGEVVSTTASVFLVGAGQQLPGAYVRLVAERGEAGKSEALRRAASSREGSELTFIRCQDVFKQIPGAPITYWLDSGFMRTFEEPPLGRFITTEGQNKTADNDRYLRYHWEVSRSHIGPGRRWITYAKGGKFRRWYGNIEHVVDWSDAARSEYRANNSCRLIAEEFWYREGITWNGVSPKGTGFRYLPAGGTFDMGGPTAFLRSAANVYSTIGFLNSGFVSTALQAMNPTINLQLKDVRALPFPESMANHAGLADLAAECVKISQLDWDELETSLDFDRPAVCVMFEKGMQLRSAANAVVANQRNVVERLADRESEVDALVNDAYRQSPTNSPKLSTSVTLWANPDYRYERVLDESERDVLRLKDCILDLVSYAVGCMFGRFSLDENGFVLSDQGSTLQDYLAKVPSPTFIPDRDNVIPIVDGEWFEDDIVGRFREFLRVAFGESHFEENLRFVVEALGVRDLRDYFVKSFYKDHVQRYKKRPIYWLFSSPKGSFSALIYMHRHTSSTVSVVLNEYLREYRGKLAASLQNQERLIGGNPTGRQQAMAQKEADRLRKVLFELDEYEHDVLYPLASEQISIDLNDGVKVNYLKFGAALKKIPGLEAGE